VKEFEEWLATSPTASFLKIMTAAGLGAVASWVATAQVDPLVVAICAAVIPVAINWLNPADVRYGNLGTKGDRFDVFVDEDE
jgi:hypothetical protein